CGCTAGTVAVAAGLVRSASARAASSAFMRSAAVGGGAPVRRSITTSRPPCSRICSRLGGFESGNAKFFLQGQHSKRCFGRFSALIFAGFVRASKGLLFIFDRQNAIANGDAIQRQRHDTARTLVGN